MFQRWNRLHRLQKTVIVVGVLLLILYVSTHLDFHHKQIKNIPSHHEHEPLAKNVINREEPPIRTSPVPVRTLNDEPRVVQINRSRVIRELRYYLKASQNEPAAKPKHTSESKKFKGMLKGHSYKEYIWFLLVYAL